MHFVRVTIATGSKAGGIRGWWFTLLLLLLLLIGRIPAVTFGTGGWIGVRCDGGHEITLADPVRPLMLEQFFNR